MQMSSINMNQIGKSKDTMEKVEIIVMIGVIWNAVLQTIWFVRTKDKH